MRRTLLLAFGATTYAAPFIQDGADIATTTERGVGTGVTEKIAPSGAVPPACQVNYNGAFGIAVMKPHVRMAAFLPEEAAAVATEASPAASELPMFPGLGIAGGLVAKPSVTRPVNASTAAATAAFAATTAAEVAPTMNMRLVDAASDPPTDSAMSTNTVTMKSTRTHTRTVTRTVVGAPKPAVAVRTAAAYMVSQIEDGQLQAPTKPVMMTITTLKAPATAGSPAPTPKAPAKTSSALVISQIADGQIQAPTAPVAVSPLPSKAKATAAASAPKGPAPGLDTAAPLAPISLAKATSPAAPTGLPASVAAGSSSDSLAGMAGMDMKMPMLKRDTADGPDVQLVACKSPTALSMTLKDGILKDSKGRIGYIASNYQFQFDGPPQSGAIYTAGFSVCNNGSLALGGKTTWYQCLSGDFYNLYDRWWAAQCQPVTINAIMLKDC